MGEIFSGRGTDKLALIAKWLTQVFFPCAKFLVEIPSVHWHQDDKKE
jgi:hypothetical protein